jgi:hypothetical protein
MASQVSRLGIPVDSILRAAKWSREATFNRFYNRELQEPDIAATVFTH